MSDVDAEASIAAPDRTFQARPSGLQSADELTPNSIGEVQGILIKAAEQGARVRIFGSELHLDGNAQRQGQLRISTRRLGRIVSYEPADMTVTVEAGVILDGLQAALRDHGQFLPLDPPPGDGATIGGIVAANVSGPLRHRHGTARDWLLGLRAVLADGSVIKSGGRVVKNVSGYDLHKVFVGSHGSLGVIAEMTFKVAPCPRVDRTFSIACGSTAEATGVIASAHEATLSLLSAELLSPTASSALTGSSSWTALVRVGGGAAAAGRTTDDLHTLASLAHASMDECSTDVWARWRAHFSPAILGLRVSVLPSHVGTVAENLDRAFAGDAAHISSTATVGLIRLNLTPRDDSNCPQLVDRARSIASQRQGFVIVDRAPTEYPDTNGTLLPRPALEIIRRLKREFDPNDLLAPCP